MSKVRTFYLQMIKNGVKIQDKNGTEHTNTKMNSFFQPSQSWFHTLKHTYGGLGLDEIISHRVDGAK